MQRAWRLVAFIAMVCAARAAARADGPASAAALPEAIATRQMKFTIPFRLDPAQNPADAPSEVRLYLSSDKGAVWRLEGTVAPAKAGFEFHAPYDGEYWFVIRTVDRQGHLHPDSGASPTPELRVVVDTLPPRLELSAQRGSGGEVRVHFQAVDPNLRGESLHIEYQAGLGPWRVVALDAPQADASRGVRVGDVAIWPESPADPINLRADISDRAGNSATAEAKLPPAAQPGPLPRGDGESAPASSQPERLPAMPGATRGHGDLTAGLGPRASDPRAAAARPAVANNPLATAPLDQIARGAVPSGGAPSGTAPSGSGPDLFPAAPARVNPAVARQFTPGRDGLSTPPGERPWMINAKSFQLEYDTDSVGPSGIAKVEIWGTRDGGKSWSSFGIDPNKHSPMRVNVDGEGLYGFRITVQNNSGLGGASPQPGDLPEVWVNVDLTKPVAKLVAAEPGAGEHAGDLAIRWEASDANLGLRPITLAFRGQPGGAWSTIAASLENTGIYFWRLDNRLPDRIFLRLEARDEAGNVTLVEPSEPVSLAALHPQGRIRNIRPDDAAAR